MRTYRTSALLGVAVCAAACGGDLLDDPSFDLWCGDSLCAWEVESGHIERVATWHPDDYGVSFRDSGTRISQMSQVDRGSCIHFSVIADNSAEAEMSLSADFGADGTSDWQVSLPASRWQTLQYWVHVPRPTTSGGAEDSTVEVVFSAAKRGEGHAVLAQLRVEEDDSCPPNSP